MAASLLGSKPLFIFFIYIYKNTINNKQKEERRKKKIKIRNRLTDHSVVKKKFKYKRVKKSIQKCL